MIARRRLFRVGRWAAWALSCAIMATAPLPLAAQTAAPKAAQVSAPTAIQSWNPDAPVQQFGRVAFDSRSLMIDGRRVAIWSSEFHPFRLPSPDLWRDILQKMKASGFNTVSIYFSWSYHSPAPGVYDFTGIRDMDRLLSMAEEEGLYVITRAGPYVNAELARGGFPGWLVNQRARARTDAPEYLAAADEWLTQINGIIARHQINGDGNGNSGSVILHQIENEMLLNTPAQARYMEHLYAKARADGINVPIFHNDIGRNGLWTPKSSSVPGVFTGPQDMYAFDGYPGGQCNMANGTNRSASPPDWGFYGTGGAKGGSSASPNTPGFMGEMGGGWFDVWGTNGQYPCTAIQRGKRYQRVFYGTNIANGLYIQSFYMGYGGTSWGWMPAPVVYTSYDYGAAISEERGLRDKALELKALGGLLDAVPDIAGMVPHTPIVADNPRVRIYHNISPESGARFILVAPTHDAKRGDEQFLFTIDLPDGQYTLPEMRLNGFDAKWLVAGVSVGGQRLIYSTSEVQTAITRGAEGDVILLYGRTDEDGTTMLRYAAEPSVEVLSGAAEADYDAARGDLRLSYAHAAPTRIRITGGGRPPLLLLIGDEAEAAHYWRAGSGVDAVLVRGPYLLRGARLSGDTAHLSGDSKDAAALELFAPAAITRAYWNGAPLTLSASNGGLVAKDALTAPTAIALPDLNQWRMADGTPEAARDFDDSQWQAIDRRTYAGTIQRPEGQANLSMDAYGFHEGDVWYRGTFDGTPDAEQIVFTYGGGGAGMAQFFLNGVFLGQHELTPATPWPITVASAKLPLPAAARGKGRQVLSVMVRNNGHNWDLLADDAHKEPRGLVALSVESREGPSFAVPISWKIQGRAGGEAFTDTARGVTNNGGQYGERMGWHLPGFDDSRWKAARLPAQSARAGTSWYRTRFDLNVPAGQDATLGLAFGDTTKPRSRQSYRVLIFVNGWHMGQFIAHIGPQRVFPIPEGILNHRGGNSIALAVTSDGARGNAPEGVRLVTMHNVRGGIPVAQNAAPQSAAENPQ